MRCISGGGVLERSGWLDRGLLAQRHRPLQLGQRWAGEVVLPLLEAVERAE
jgi:hypothetical protein